MHRAHKAIPAPNTESLKQLMPQPSRATGVRRKTRTQVCEYAHWQAGNSAAGKIRYELLASTFCRLFPWPHMAVTFSSSLQSVYCHQPFKCQIFWTICGGASLLFNTAKEGLSTWDLLKLAQKVISYSRTNSSRGVTPAQGSTLDTFQQKTCCFGDFLTSLWQQVLLKNFLHPSSNKWCHIKLKKPV